AQTELVDKSSHDALEERVAGRFRVSGFDIRFGFQSAVRDRLRLTTGYRRLTCRRSLGFALHPPTSEQAVPLRQLHNLLEGLVHLPGCLGMNAVAPALLDAEVTVPRELIRPHQ